MAIAKMKLVNILSERSRLHEVLLRFIDLDCFHPEPASKIVELVHGLTTIQEEDPYQELITRFKDIEMSMGLSLPEVKVKSDHCEMDEIRRYMEDI